MARATTSLPVPDSPSTSTLESWTATWSISERIWRMAGDSPVGPRCVTMAERTSSSAVAMNCSVVSLLFARTCSVANLRRRKSDATRQSSEDPCDGRLVSWPPRLAGAGNLTPVTAERQFFEQVGRGFTRRDETGLHMAIGRHMRDVGNQCQGLRQAVTQPDLQEALLADARRIGRLPQRTERIEA